MYLRFIYNSALQQMRGFIRTWTDRGQSLVWIVEDREIRHPTIESTRNNERRETKTI